VTPLPHRIAVLAYLFDEAGRVLLIHRHKEPNFDLHSPIGGKLEQDDGESPTGCAIREIEEEAGLLVTPDDLRLTGIVSERAFEDAGHWLIFLYEVTRPVEVTEGPMSEGRLEWHPLEALKPLAIPDTDRRVMWPLFLQHRGRGFFMAHIECAEGDFVWRLEQSVGAGPGPLAPEAAPLTASRPG